MADALFAVVTNYLADSPAVDAKRDEHLIWVKQQYDAGRFLISGRRIPAHGGVMVLRAADRSQAVALLGGDPYARAGLVEWRIYEFAPTQPPSQDPGVTAFLARDIGPEGGA